MSAETLLELKFRGARFDAHTLPLALLKDIESLQGIINVLARDEFLSNSPERQRMPRGLVDALTLHLTATDEGSFLARIGLIVATATLPMLSPASTAAQTAAHRLIALIEEAANGETQSIHTLPDAAWAHIERLGRGLRDDESLELGQTSGRTVSLTPDVRRRLLMARPGAQAITEDVDLIVQLVDVRPEQHTLSVRLDDGRTVLATVSSSEVRELHNVRVGDFGTTWLQIAGIGSINRAGQVERFDEVQSLERLSALDLRVQMSSLMRLKEGWLDGKGQAIDRKLLAMIATWLEEHLPDDSELPRLYPTPEGGIEAEWMVGRLDLSVEFDPTTRRLEWHALDLDGDSVEAREVDLDDVEAVATVGGRLREVLAGSVADGAAPGEVEPS